MSNQTEIGRGVPFHRIRRITGYLVGSLDRWGNAKRAEERDRVKHNVGNGKSSKLLDIWGGTVLEWRQRQMVKNGWVYCPHCGKKLFPVGKTTVIKNWICLCRKCGRRFLVNIESRE